MSNSFAERMRSYFRDSLMQPNWVKDRDLDQNLDIMAATEKFILNNHADDIAPTSKGSAQEQAVWSREHCDSELLVSAEIATSYGPNQKCENTLDLKIVKTPISSGAA